MNVDVFLERLEGVTRQSDSQWNATCPAHDDQHASLSVGLSTDRILIHCHAGCTAEDITAAWGATVGDLFFNVRSLAPSVNGRVRIPPKPPQRVPPAERREIRGWSAPPEFIIEKWSSKITEIAGRLYELKGWTLPTLQHFQTGFDCDRVIWPVRDHTESCVGIVRYKPGHKPKTLAAGERNLFPAPESVELPDLWLVEGEPDALTAWELGIAAVAVPGVGKWRDEWCSRFQGRSVTICMDADREGRDCAYQRANALDRAGVKVAVVDIAPDRSDGTDLGDLLTYALATDRVGDLKAHLSRLSDEAWRLAA